MSRILYVANDNRPIPREACWWRLKLPHNDDGNVCVQQWWLPPGQTMPEYMPWAAHLDYFDGKGDWSWPFGTVLRQKEFRRHWDQYSVAPPSNLWYLYLHDVIPPDVSIDSKWEQITLPGDSRLPDEQAIDRYNLARRRPQWDLIPPTHWLRF